MSAPRIPFLDTLGIRPGPVGAMDATAAMPFQAGLANSSGSLHGGALMGALDYAMSAAAKGDAAEASAVSTVDMRTSFLRGATGNVSIEARCLQRGRSVAFCEATARDEAGRLVATASATFSLRQRGTPQ